MRIQGPAGPPAFHCFDWGQCKAKSKGSEIVSKPSLPALRWPTAGPGVNDAMTWSLVWNDIGMLSNERAYWGCPPEGW